MVNRYVVTLANSIVGVSVLAMPFCFKQCGIVLATLSLMIGAVMTRMVCYFLLKAAVINRRRTYEMLAWSTFGQTGKFLVEISIIGFLIGTLIAFMVVIGDLGPEILSEMFSVENNPSLRTIIMTALSLFVALPLGMLRNLDSLGSVSTASVLFYMFLVIKIVGEGFGPLWSGEYLERIHFWRSSGVLQCIPIFSMALSCQTQIFGIYDSLAEPSVQKMNEIVKQSVYICTFFYFCVGFFGYIAYGLNPNFGGNILLSFAPAWSTQLIKSMFLMSVVFSVPLVVFPCRASLHSLMFKSGGAYHHVHDISTNYIPESRMKFLTVSIVGFTLMIGILIPNIELVLGLVGSTTGSVICIIFPSIMFVRVTSKHTTERLLAQTMFIFGVVLMLLTTYATLYAAEQTQMNEHIPDQFRVTEDLSLLKPPHDAQLNSPVSQKSDEKLAQIHRVEFEHKVPDKMISKSKDVSKKENSMKSPMENIKPKSTSHLPRKLENGNTNIDSGEKHPVEGTNINNNAQQREKQFKPEPRRISENHESIESNIQSKTAQGAPVKQIKSSSSTTAPFVQKHVDTDIRSKNNDQLPQNKDNANQSSLIHEEKSGDKKDFADPKVAEELLKRIEKQQEDQKKLLEEQKLILKELKEHHAQDVREKEEQVKQKDEETEKSKPKPIESKKMEKQVVPSLDEKTSDKLIKDQEKIIEKLSENIKQESNNAVLLKNLEEKLVKVEERNIENEKPIRHEEKLIHEETHKNNIMEDNNISSAVKKDESFPPQESVQKINVKNDVMKTIDKEKGVLVGSLTGSKNNDYISAVDKENQKNFSSPQSHENDKTQNLDLVNHLQSSLSEGSQQGPLNNVVHRKSSDKLEDHDKIVSPSSNKQKELAPGMAEAINKNKNIPLPKHENLAIPGSVSSASVAPKKSDSADKVNKEKKVDREI